MVTTTQAAALMGVSVRTLWRMIEDGELRIAGVIGNSNVFYKHEVLEVRQRLYGG
ncbi:MAG: helix-turn-helix domain-containing protein [Candidatus Rokuibacteriota bacterium]